MAVAAPARRSQSQAAPAAPARTAPPEPKKRPRDRPRPGGPARSNGTGNAAAAPATAPKKRRKATSAATAAPKRAAGRKAGAARASAATAAPARKAAPSRRQANAEPARTPRSPKRRTGARVIPIAAGTVGRTAVAVTQLPESGLIHRLTRGRAWIGVLGVLLIGIVGLNVVTLSFAASAGKVDERIQALSRENSVLQSLQAKKYGQARINHEAKKQGLSASTAAEPTMVSAGKGDVGTAAKRLAAAGAAGAAAGVGAVDAEGEASASESSPGEEAASGEGAAGGVVSGGDISQAEIESLSQEEQNRIYEETLAREAGEVEGAGVESEVGYEEPVAGQSVTETPTE